MKQVPPAKADAERGVTTLSPLTLPPLVTSGASLLHPGGRKVQQRCEANFRAGVFVAGDVTAWAGLWGARVVGSSGLCAGPVRGLPAGAALAGCGVGARGPAVRKRLFVFVVRCPFGWKPQGERGLGGIARKHD